MKKLELSEGKLEGVVLIMEDGAEVDMSELSPEDFNKFTELMRKLNVASDAFDSNRHGN